MRASPRTVALDNSPMVDLNSSWLAFERTAFNFLSSPVRMAVTIDAACVGMASAAFACRVSHSVGTNLNK